MSSGLFLVRFLVKCPFSFLVDRKKNGKMVDGERRCLREIVVVIRGFDE